MKITKLLKIILLGVGVIMFYGCKDKSLDYYTGTEPAADLKAFFDGPIEGWGLIQDWRGRVVTRFDVKMVGTWKGNEGRLEEDFVYYDGKKQKRIWTIHEKQDGTFEGYADDIIDKAVGHQKGSAIRWAYLMDVPVDGRTFRLKFDDWMWQMNDGVVVNRSYLKKFGFTVAELTLVMKKES
jgi:hypothetical protein